MREATPRARAARATDAPSRPGARIVSWVEDTVGERRKKRGDCRAACPAGSGSASPSLVKKSFSDRIGVRRENEKENEE